MSRNNIACESCSDTRPERRLLGIVVAVAVGVAAFSTASLVFADSRANMRYLIAASVADASRPSSP